MNVQEDGPKYWSAYVQLEHRDIPKLWMATRRDYVFVSAKVTIPTRRGKIMRDFPLFMIEKGSVQSLQGVDLLQRFPLSRDSREQLVVEVEVKLLRDVETLRMVRVVLDEARKAAEPYLSNFTVATSIVGSPVASHCPPADLRWGSMTTRYRVTRLRKAHGSSEAEVGLAQRG